MKTIAQGLCTLSTILLLALPMLADDEIPYSDLSNNSQIPTNVPTARPLGVPPPTPGGAPTAPDSPSTETNFLAVLDNVTLSPPDTMGAVGPNHVMTMLNTQVRIQSRTGHDEFYTNP
ncbi:MAG TPA: hypothetical protein VK615_00625 [Candidatus Binatia bacterium]|nr:hypothetical protein [Candidatus Binatia bacterium]